MRQIRIREPSPRSLWIGLDRPGHESSENCLAVAPQGRRRITRSRFAGSLRSARSADANTISAELRKVDLSYFPILGPCPK
jgi:hypothetical protein